MVPAAQANGRQRADDIRYDIVEIECAAIRQEALEEFRSDAQDAGAGDEREVERASPGGVEDPVEAGGEDEEGEGVDDFVVDVGVDLDGGEPGVCCCCDEEEEGSWTRSPVG